jgi:5,10-methylenetetrahydromethanopterin reductase
MKIGINGTGLVQKASIPAIIQHAQQAATDGFKSYWLAEHPTGGFDVLTVLAAVGLAVPNLQLGTAIVPTFPRHPAALAAQTVTTNNLIEGRLTLGIGLSHAPMMAELGIDFERPIGHLKGFLETLMPLVREGAVDTSGEFYSAKFRHFQTPSHPLTVLVAALGPQALGVTGRQADGTILAWVGPKTIRAHIAPRLFAAANKAGNPSPSIVSSLPVCVTSDPEGIRAKIAGGLKMYGQLPSYRAMFDLEGADGPADVAIVGSRAEVEDGIQAMADAGVTEFAPTEFVTNADEAGATRGLLTSLFK